MIKPILRNVVLRACRVIGLLHIWRWIHRHDITIVTIHGVMDSSTPACWSPLRPQLSPGTLDSALQALQRHYRFISIQHAVDMLAGRRPVVSYGLVLTFDDGYRNNLTHALPILRRHGVPATLFLATGHVDQRRPFWFDRLDYAIQHAPAADRILIVAGTRIPLPRTGRVDQALAYRRLRAAAKHSPHDDAQTVRELECLAQSLEQEGGRGLSDIFETDPWSAVATWDELRGAAGPDIEFGSHTVDHARLHRADAATVHTQLAQSKRMIESRLGRPCRYLCYPNGDFDTRAVAIARECGYDAAVTTAEGDNQQGADLFTLRRRSFPPTSDVTELLAQLSGFSAALARASTLFPRRLRPAQPSLEAHNHLSQQP